MRNDSVAFIGLGDMGEPMAHNLLAAGFRVTVFDVRAQPLALARDKGATVAKTPADIPAQCPVIGLCLWNEQQIDDVLHGEHGLMRSEARDVTLLVHSTVTPQLVARIVAACDERGWTVLDAPVSGGRAGSVAATLTLMVGGDKPAFERCLPYFNAVGKHVFHVGTRPGAGAVAKLCNNLMALCNIFALAEATQLAAAYDVNEKTMLDVARVSTGNSWWIENWGFFDNLIGTHAQPDVLSKDLWECVEAAREKGLELTIAGVTALSAPRLTRERLASLAAAAQRDH
jgi:3-hydroxyisobutyrate dehydrogenase-like beta-hydroxyacid dehydrogenase